uniref:Odv-e66a n=2 Tax=Mamestra configurata nucleopolyhedrovirus TaxID=207830 RepID=A0A7G7Y862_NPVMC|nr:odv-e66a [Mamestra configurata nucleopolyhedrovirus A]QNH90558.1 odv-e66a [Mamestra configurata nucleopolyhedrovirus A]QNH90889.1 odv-e66a [Mamestra configurata nucleopolyhedrovirus A]UVZ34913.1 ODV-E66A [Melanchra picta nucleopolyhedrovirus]UVZ35084.1 ODV-E66A [Melanchra picta nucleopolyhedrovirus]
MWLYIFIIVAFVIFVLILIWQTDVFIATNALNPLIINVDLADDSNYKNDLAVFEKYYLDTLQAKFLQKAEKVAHATRQFSDDGNIFVNMNTWSSAVDFGIVLHTLIGYGVRFNNRNDELYENAELAYRLYEAMHLIYERVPIPAPTHSAPWGDRTDWYHFSITMPECFQNTCIVLRDHYDLRELTESLLHYYLPLPTLSMGWWRTAGNAMRMCLPYCYGQLLRGYTFAEIGEETQVQYVLDLIKFPLVKSGNGIHYDYAYFDHTDVRAYGYLVNSYFTFSYYNFLFGEDTVNMQNVYNSLSLIGSNQGVVNPALLSRNGSNYSAVLAHLIEFVDGVISGDFSKILTVRNNRYFGSVVGQSPDIAYYEADPNNSLHAPLWAMTRRIWSNTGRVLSYRSVGLESGILLTTNLSGVVNIPTTGPSTSSFHPTLAYTALAATENAGVMAMHVRLAELNLEFHSYTLYHRYGMFHLYDKIRTLRHITNNARCVVLVRDNNNESRWTSASNLISANGITAKHHNIINNNSLSNFDVRTFDALNLQTAEQIIGAELMNRGGGVTCFSLLAQDVAGNDNTTITRIPESNILVIATNSNSIQCVIDFPVVVLKDEETRQITINDATNISRNLHQLSIDKIVNVLSVLSLSVDSLILPANITRSANSFYLQNDHGNQFKFMY